MRSEIRQIIAEQDAPSLAAEIEVEAAQPQEIISVAASEQPDQLFELQQQIEESDQKIAKLKKWLGLAEANSQQLTEQCQQQQAESAQLQRQLATAQQVAQVAQKQLQQQQDVLTDLEQRLAWYRDNFDRELRLYETHQGLSDATKASLSGIFKDVSIQGLIACGVQESNIANLWEYIKAQTVEGNNADLAKLHYLFDELFARFVLAYPMYQRTTGETGTAFDAQLHIKHHSSVATSGSIQQVMLSGYRNLRTDKVIKQSLILL
ncbi:hypothetical protein [Ferrimonas senticii]|uniref:hypothetical protein n=1 Tax=Ferrimonas senticii TaxID=394566 RepID=UPI0012EC3AB4|nr:hypothetical protein [Ferrimonas senticii]